MDLKGECFVSESQSSSSNNSNGNSNTNPNGELKKCTDCQTTTTPLWRGGPAGPKTLCNACGIKYHKKRRALLGLDKGKIVKANKKEGSMISNNMMKMKNHHHNVGMPLKIKVMQSGMRRSDKLGEVEQAAMLLMALSYGSVYA